MREEKRVGGGHPVRPAQVVGRGVGVVVGGKGRGWGRCGRGSAVMCPLPAPSPRAVQ